MKEKKFGCLIFEDQLGRLQKFDDAALGRIVRTALTATYQGEENHLENLAEWYACDELISSFLRNKTSLEQPSIDGQVGNAYRYADTLDDFKERIDKIEGLTTYEKHQHIERFKEEHPDKC